MPAILPACYDKRAKSAILVDAAFAFVPAIAAAAAGSQAAAASAATATRISGTAHRNATYAFKCACQLGWQLQ